MSLLFTGSGAREVAIAWKISQDHPELDMFFAPGNAQTAKLGYNLPLAVPSTREPQAVWDQYFADLYARAKACQVDLLLVFPEDALAHGVVDFMTARRIKTFGPTQAAAKVESSKIWAKELMRELDIPTAPFRVLDTVDEVHTYFATRAIYPVVVKDDGLAGGKGVTIARNQQQALAVALGIVAQGRRVLVEEFLTGWEISAFGFVGPRKGQRGESVLRPWGIATDYKTFYTGGPNTGGIGVYSPNPLVTPDIANQAYSLVARMADGMADRGSPFNGCLFGGLIVVDGKVYVLEFNCRPGDPETQALIVQFEGDLLEVFRACIDGGLEDVRYKMSGKPTVGVVSCSRGYPAEYRVGEPITGLDALPEGVIVFQSGTAERGGQLVTDGGRVLTLVASGTTFAQARELVYRGARRADFNNRYYRKDVALGL